MGRLRLEDFADRTQPTILEMGDKRLEEPANHPSIVIDAKVRIEIRSQQPGPHHPHVIGGVARALIAVVGGLIPGVVWTQRPQPEWRQQLGCNPVERRPRTIALDQGIHESERDHLVGAQAGIVAIGRIDHVIAVAALPIPEPRLRRFVRLRRHLPVASRRSHGPLAPVTRQPQRVVPEGVDLDGLAASRRDNPVPHARIHPGERVALLAAGEQSIPMVHADVVPGSADVPVDDPFERLQPVRDESPVTARSQVGGQCLEQPQGRVDRVVLRLLATIRKSVRDETVIQICDAGVEHRACFPE